jgi:hypothetical protein
MLYPLQALGSFPISLPLAYWMTFITFCFLAIPASASLIWAFWTSRVIPQKMQPEIPNKIAA